MKIKYEEMVVNLSRMPFGKYEEVAMAYLEHKENIKIYKCSRGSNNVGIPDCYYVKDGEIIFIEIKSSDDSLRRSQISWIYKHPNEKVRLIYFDFIDGEKSCVEEVEKIVEKYYLDEKKIESVIDNITNPVSLVKSKINALEIKLGKIIPIDDIVDLCRPNGLNSERVKETIEKLKRTGDVFEPRRGFLSKI